MAALRFQFAVEGMGGIAPPILTPEQIAGIGREMVRAQKERWSRAENIMDRAARPLAPKTAKGKVTYGREPKRNMLMTGLVIDNFTLRSATMNGIRAENTSREARMHARKAQKFETMIGFSPSDQDTVFRLAYRAYGLYLQRAWRPSRG